MLFLIYVVVVQALFVSEVNNGQLFRYGDIEMGMKGPVVRMELLINDYYVFATLF